MPEELEIANRQIMKLEVEKQALLKDAEGNGEGAAKAKKRIKEIEKEISNRKEKISALELKWKNEKDAIGIIRGLKKEMETVRLEAETAERRVDLARVAELRYGKIPEIEKKIKQEENRLKKFQTSRRILNEEITEEDIANIVSRWTGIPVSKMLEGEAEKLLRMEDELRKRVIGQDEAIKKISEAVRRSRAGISYEDRPIGSFMFLGPTGVGKTELAKVLAKFMFNDEKALIRVDMSEYMERHSVSKFIGAPAGYVGYEEGGQLTEQVRHRPYSIILFDEIEKAHPEVFNVMLQILDNGHLTDSKGRKVNFKNTVLIMTSNVGSQFLRHAETLGFATKEEKESEKKTETEIRERIKKALEAKFKPEFLNRLDEIIIFNTLSRKDIEKIVKIQIDMVAKRLLEKDIILKVSDTALSFLAKEGYNPHYGARPLKRFIQNKILNPVATLIIANKIKLKGVISVDVKNGDLKIELLDKNRKATKKKTVANSEN